MTRALRDPRASYPVRAPNPTHRFEIHQQVRLYDDEKFSTKHVSADGIYEVMRLMPCNQAGVFQYRVSSSGGERIVAETQIRANDDAQ